MLQSILVFYDRFAELNETDSRLQGEAARSHRKVAALYRMLGRDTEADEALARATERFESLTALFPNVTRYRFELARTYALDDQYPPDSIEPARIEQGILKALPLVQKLADESPGQEDYVMALARWKARLGDALKRQGQLGKAELALRESIAHDESLLDHFDHPEHVQVILAKNREARAQILQALGRSNEAKALLDRATDGLISIRINGWDNPGAAGPLAERFSCLAESYGKLGDKRRAADCEDRARELRPRGPRDRSGPRGGGPHGPGSPWPGHDRRPPQ